MKSLKINFKVTSLLHNFRGIISMHKSFDKLLRKNVYKMQKIYQIFYNLKLYEDHEKI